MCVSSCICSGQCTACQGTNCDKCLSCNPGFYLSQQNCVPGCPYNTYVAYNQYIMTNVCMSCNNNCRTCFGPLAEQCVSCQLPNYFQNGSCVNQCSVNNFYMNVSNLSCNPCDVSCLTCSGPNYTQCLVLFFFIILLFLGVF